MTNRFQKLAYSKTGKLKMLPYRQPVASHWVTQVQERGDKLYQRGWKGSVDRRGRGWGERNVEWCLYVKKWIFVRI